jgi:carbonic anhydrase
MKELPHLFTNNSQWVEETLSKDPNYFKKLSLGQDPKYLWIGCSDSRVPAEELLGLEAGQLFVHRNIANLCIHTDFSFLSVLEFAVTKLHIEHIIVAGHYACAGVRAALENEEIGLADNWLRNIRDVSSKYSAELGKITDEKKRFDTLVELNVKEQVKNVCHTPIVQRAWKQNKHLCVHGWVYDLSSGKLKDLNVSYSQLDHIDFGYPTV